MAERILVVDDSPTIRKIVETILIKRDYQPVSAADGIEALDKLDEAPVDLVLLDFVMPRMNGYQFCRELRAREGLKQLPVVLMSAKGDKIRNQFVLQTGAIDAITKPFDARGLIAVVEGALERKKGGRARPIPEADKMPIEEPRESLFPGPISLSDDPGLRKIEAARAFSQALGDRLVPGLVKLAGSRVQADLLQQALDEAITAETLAELGTLLRTLDFGEDHQDVLSGDVGVISIAEIVQLLQMQRQSGALSVLTPDAEVTLCLKAGTLDYAGSRGLPAEYLLGRYLVHAGAVSRNDLDTVLENPAGSQRLLGEKLVQLRLASEAQVQSALVQQTSELLYEVVRWKKGRFRCIAAATNPIAEKAALGLSIGGLVMEGFRRVDEWQLIEGSFDFNEVLFPDQAAIANISEPSKLTALEHSVLEAINGERTVREIVDTMGGSSFELCRILYQFLNSRLVRRRAA
jgi:CheY-like chemotaxis protein